jgi:hypothetical protein
LPSGILKNLGKGNFILRQFELHIHPQAEILRKAALIVLLNLPDQRSGYSLIATPIPAAPVRLSQS